MTTQLLNAAIRKDIRRFLKEDDLARNLYYTSRLPMDEVHCEIYFKSDLVIAGLPFFFEVFQSLLGEKISCGQFLKHEGAYFSKTSVPKITFNLPFGVALTGERIALNLLQRCSSIATHTKKFVDKSEKYKIAILDTRKTLPGYRAFDKYAVRTGGGQNHRFGQADVWMAKDNHKAFFGGLKGAIDFFKSVGSFYSPVVVEIHDLKEFSDALKLGVKHVMLDNFSPADVQVALAEKPEGMTFEISGGITLESIDKYLIKGVDAISIGSLTYGAPPVDISFKYSR